MTDWSKVQAPHAPLVIDPQPMAPLRPTDVLPVSPVPLAPSWRPIHNVMVGGLVVLAFAALILVGYKIESSMQRKLATSIEDAPKKVIVDRYVPVVPDGMCKLSDEWCIEKLRERLCPVVETPVCAPAVPEMKRTRRGK